jgi:hypothetical protein
LCLALAIVGRQIVLGSKDDEGRRMTDSEYDTKQQEIDRILNDPETPMRPDRIWALLEDLARSGPKSARDAEA